MQRFPLLLIFLLVVTLCSKPENKVSKGSFGTLHKKYTQEFKNTEGTTNAQVKKWIDGYWDLRIKFPNTSGASKATVEAYKLAVKFKAIKALDTLFQKTSIHEDAMAELLAYLPYTPIYEDAIPNLRDIRLKSKNPKVRAAALLQSAITHQRHRRYGQVAVLLDSLATHYDINYRHPEYGENIQKLQKNIAKNSVGQPLNDFQMTTINNRTFDSKDFNDQVTLIYFYNTGCGSCIAMIPYLNRLNRKYKNGDFSLLGVSADKPYMSEEEFQNKLKDLNITWPQSLDIDLFAQYKIQKVSTIFLIDQTGKLVLMSESKEIAETIPRLKGLKLEEAIKRLLY